MREELQKSFNVHKSKKTNMFSENGQPTQARYVFHCGAFMWKKRVRGFFYEKTEKRGD